MNAKRRGAGSTGGAGTTGGAGNAGKAASGGATAAGNAGNTGGAGAGPVLSARNIDYTIGAARLLSAVDLDLHRGELVGLIGPNGAGKSTLLRILIGFLQPTAVDGDGRVGKVRLYDRPLNMYAARERARHIAYLSQYGPDQFPFPVVEIVEMGAYPSMPWGVPADRTSTRRRREAALDALRYVGLEHLSNRSFPSLSGGERQLALFARILVQESPLILLDEPTASLDIGHETTLMQMVRDLCAEGYAAIVALHNLNVAAEYCDRLVLMDGGRVRTAGPPDAVLTKAWIEPAYRCRVEIGRNESTGGITVSPVPAGRRSDGPRVHVIGGAGSAVNITRFLHRNGCRVSGGVAHELDSDTRLWEALGVPHVTVPAFAEIDDAAFAAALALVEQADSVVLCAFPVGKGNAANLRLAAHAKRLIVLREADGDIGRERRFFFDPEGTAATFDSLVANHRLMTYRQACEHIEKEVLNHARLQ